MKKVLITGAESFLGVSVEKYIKEHYSSELSVDTISLLDHKWRNTSFSSYDVVYHVAGLAHADVSNLTEEEKDWYYSINTDLAIETATKAKKDGIKHFVFMSSILVYGDSAPHGKLKMITPDTMPSPSNIYGDSKLKAEQGILELSDDGFIVSVLRPPMIYGKGSKGNYPVLSRMAGKYPLFPNIRNQRSMLYIENFCEFFCQMILAERSGIFYPQNHDYVSTSDMVRIIADVKGHKILIGRAFNWIVSLASLIPGKTRNMANKAFGSLCYEKDMSKYDFDYQSVDFEESIRRTES